MPKRGASRSSAACSSATGRSGAGSSSAAVAASPADELLLLAQAGPEEPHAACQDREQHQHAEDRQVDLRGQPPHQSSSCLRAKT